MAIYPAISADELAREHLARSGLIPVSVDAANRQIAWLDIDTFHFYQSFFSDGLNFYAALSDVPPEGFLSSFRSLSQISLKDCLPPSAFIFHAARCGSTLLAKVLARSRKNLVFSEAAPHNQIWPALNDSGAVELYRTLLTAMGRRRLPSYRAHIVKFTSFNIMEFAFIRRAFPEVPALFLFRRPDALLRSCHREPPGWLGQTVGNGRIWHSPEAAVEAFFRSALTISDPAFRRLDYQSVPDNLERIAAFFQLQPDDRDLSLMTSEFLWDAKSRIPGRFSPSPDPVNYDLPETLQQLYLELTRQAVNDWS